MILLSGGGLLVNTLVRLKTVDLGFAPDRLWTAEFMAPKALYPETAQVGLLGGRAADALGRLPGVVAVGDRIGGCSVGSARGTRSPSTEAPRRCGRRPGTCRRATSPR